jgi:hypothetical protein
LTRFRHYPSLLAALYPLFSPDEEDGVRDNAAAAVARMILACPGTIPLPQVLPVFLGALPLKEDLEEAGIVYGCLFTLIGHSPNEVIIRVVPLEGLFLNLDHWPLLGTVLDRKMKIILNGEEVLLHVHARCESYSKCLLSMT